MIEDLIRNERFRRIFPPVAAVGFIALFVVLGFWQLDRAAEKERLQALFENDAPFFRITGNLPFTDYQNIEANGRYQDDRQVLIDNIFVNSRIGAYVITPFRYAADKPLLIVNRGWIPRPTTNEPDPDLRTDSANQTIRGRAGHLPRVGIRPGPPFEGDGDWPKNANYPMLTDLSAELGEEVLPFVLLLNPETDGGFVRDWQPRGSGPMMHYGYAFQWFAMATAVFVILWWQMRKRRLQQAA